MGNELLRQDPSPFKSPFHSKVDFKAFIQMLEKQFMEQGIVHDRSAGDDQPFGIRFLKALLNRRNQKPEFTGGFFNDAESKEISLFGSLGYNQGEAGDFTFCPLRGIEKGDRLAVIREFEESEQLFSHPGGQIPLFDGTKGPTDRLAGDPPARTFVAKRRPHAAAADFRSMFVSSEGYRAGAADEAQTESPRIVHREQQVDVRHQQKGKLASEDLLEGSFPASPLFRPGKTGVAETEAQNRPTFEAGSDIFDQEADGPDRFVKADDIRIARRARRMGYERAMPVPRSDSTGRAAAVSTQIDSFHTMSMEEDHRYCKEGRA